MVNQSLLPINQTAHEQLMSKTLAEGYHFDAHQLIRSLYNSQNCPAHLLSYLAQAVAVDFWHYGWSEQRKRDVINQALEIHRLKGTPAAALKALQNQGIKASLREWWQQGDPQWWLPTTTAAAGTVVIHTLVNDNPNTQVDKTKLAQMQQAMTHAKRESIHFSIELGFKWDEQLAFAMVRSPTIAYSERCGDLTPLHPRQGQHDLTLGGGNHRITLADFEFSGATT